MTAPTIANFPARKNTRISFSLAQLAAAAALLMAVSGATAWFLRGSVDGPAPVSTPAVIQAEIEPRAMADAVRPVNFADAQYDAAIADLERTLDERRNDLNPRTVEILERNLKLIDAAIAQARQALEEDPANAYLNRHLVESRRRKLDLLRRATTINDAD
jgi:tetratricopeptide (TPR) repeat protein